MGARKEELLVMKAPLCMHPPFPSGPVPEPAGGGGTFVLKTRSRSAENVAAHNAAKDAA